MSHEVSDLLEVLLPAKEAGLPQWHWHLQVVPCLKPWKILQRAPSVMQQLFELPLYRAFLPLSPHLSTLTCRGDAGLLGQQQDSGFLSSNWKSTKPKKHSSK